MKASAPLDLSSQYQRILGINFYVGTAEEAVKIGMQGGLIAVPAAPLLETMPNDPVICEALTQSDLAIADSGLMVLVWNLISKKAIRRISGLKYLRLLLDEPAFHSPGSSFWIMPSEDAMAKNLHWLQAHGHSTTPADCYLAPHYKPNAIIDEALLEIINEKQPPHIVMAVGGGVQEKLGHYLKLHANYRPAIHCTGAAIGFLSGDQVYIPEWADRYFLGWAFRCLATPQRFIPRYWKARKLVRLVLQFKERCPRQA